MVGRVLHPRAHQPHGAGLGQLVRTQLHQGALGAIGHVERQRRLPHPQRHQFLQRAVERLGRQQRQHQQRLVVARQANLRDADVVGGVVLERCAVQRRRRQKRQRRGVVLGRHQLRATCQPGRRRGIGPAGRGPGRGVRDEPVERQVSRQRRVDRGRQRVVRRRTARGSLLLAGAEPSRGQNGGQEGRGAEQRLDAGRTGLRRTGHCVVSIIRKAG